jgi:hypothetical protein
MEQKQQDVWVWKKVEQSSNLDGGKHIILGEFIPKPTIRIHIKNIDSSPVEAPPGFDTRFVL